MARTRLLGLPSDARGRYHGTMCGRFSLTASWDEIRRYYDLIDAPMNLAPRYNVAPTQTVPVVRRTSARECEAVMMRWGLIPSWAKDARLGARMINARAETVAEKPAFRGAFRSRRCLVPADGFYEWQARTKGKQPYRIARPDGGLFSFAGLWERWEKAPDGAPVESFTFLTTTATPELHPIHPRMPVILKSSDHAAWLDGEVAGAHPVGGGAGDETLVAIPIGTRINDVRNDDDACIEPAG
ncbi:MAG TPA: SOS response-associated peptidase [Rhodospirillales bacterium]|nr:SOS response-associated peptidase [Rhodospirillales bacterium]